MKILITNEQIQEKIKELGEHITNIMVDKHDIIVAPILKGGLVFGSHLIPYLNFQFELDYFHTSRYKNNTYGSNLEIIYEPKNLKGKTLILLDDIYDEGTTLDTLEARSKIRGASKVVKVVLLNKEKNKSNPPIFSGFKIPDYFVYGFGLDKNGFFRNLPYIAYDED